MGRGNGTALSEGETKGRKVLRYAQFKSDPFQRRYAKIQVNYRPDPSDDGWRVSGLGDSGLGVRFSGLGFSSEGSKREVAEALLPLVRGSKKRVEG